MRKKRFLVYVVISTFFCLTFSSVLLAQWSPYGNAGWFSQPFISLPFFSFNPMYNYSYNNIQYPFYNNYYSPFSTYNNSLTLALPISSSSGSWYNTPVNYIDSYNQSWFDNSAYRSRSYTTVYNNFQPPPLGIPGYTNWSSSGYNADYPFRYGSGPPLNIPRQEPKPIDITADTGKWESQELTDEDGNNMKGSLEYDRSEGILKMTGSSLPLGEGFLTAFQYTPANGSAPISFKAGFDSGYTAVFTGTAKNTIAVSSYKYASLPLDYFVVDGEYVIRDSLGQIADSGTFKQ